MKRRIILGITGGVFATLGIIFAVLLFLSQPPQKDGGSYTFVVSRDMSGGTIVQKLQGESFIKSGFVFSILRPFDARGKEIKPGGYTLSKNMNAWEVIDVVTNDPSKKWVVLTEKLNNADVVKIFADTFGWDEQEKEGFSKNLALAQWAAYKKETTEILNKTFKWRNAENEALTALHNPEESNLLKHIYVPDSYLISANESMEQIAGNLVNIHQEQYTLLEQNIDWENAEKIAELIRYEVELLPDIVPLPATELSITKRKGQDVLIFSATYWNKGKGPLELIADPKSRGIGGDIERDVYQRIYRIDGEYRDKLVGNFQWHSAAGHLHYHYRDFIDYIFEAIDVEGDVSIPKTKEKRTYCIRDMHDIDLFLPNSPQSKAYLTCNKEKQGVSVGWGDKYSYTLSDQYLVVDDLPRGTYLLSFHVNPDNILDETTKDNNTASILLDIDVEERRVEVVDPNEKI